MKVLIVPSWYISEDSPNSGIFFKEQALALQNIGLDVTIIYPEISSLRYIKKGFVKTGIIKEVESGLMTYRYKGFNYLPKVSSGKRRIIYRRLKKLYLDYVKKNGRPDIIHAHSILWGGWAATRLAEKYNIPIIITEHSSAIGSDLIKEEDKKYIKSTLESADQIIAVGESLKKDLETYKVKKNIEVIPNIVDVEKFKPKSIKSKQNEKFTFFSLGFLLERKGMDVLIKAFAKAFRGNESVELIIGGDGNERKYLGKLAIEQAVQKQIKFTGDLNRDQVGEQMDACDVFVLASKHETFGVVYIEALAYGKPIIATKCGGPEGIVTKNNGMLVEIDDVSGLAEKMQEIKRDYNKYDPKKIRSECVRNYSSSNISKRLDKKYNEVIKNY